VNLSGVITSLGALPYTVTRRESTYVSGRRVTATPATFDIVAMVQPLSGRELARLPEGMRTRELRAVWTTADLRVDGEPDSLSVDGVEWEVQLKTDWAVLGGFRHYIMAKVPQ
jgi:hypothetical protein